MPMTAFVGEQQPERLLVVPDRTKLDAHASTVRDCRAPYDAIVIFVSSDAALPDLVVRTRRDSRRGGCSSSPCGSKGIASTSA